MPEIRVDTGEARCPAVEANIVVDCRGETCPVPLVETRKALRRAAPGDVIEVIGTHPASRKEIPMAVEALGLRLLCVEGTDTDWTIRIQR
ncbi:MAG: sulfurtransferase TusA family protein [Chloroflexi bacterium]|nr:MAG: sulfurtransferase TusA family protein [Chloroflexota bacterium]RLC90214.1 MAG: sulfurtransferase TusA family protein [Chloroflexota bacterium]HEY67995.1 sulfurtransferase TusA family protein [Thermoflexia bacterium]